MATFQTESQHYIFLLRIPYEFICQFICDEKLRTLFTNWNPLVCIPNDTFEMRYKGILTDFSFFFFFDEIKKKKNDKTDPTLPFIALFFKKSGMEKCCDCGCRFDISMKKEAAFHFLPSFFCYDDSRQFESACIFFFICHLFVIPFFGTCLSYPCNLVYDDTS